MPAARPSGHTATVIALVGALAMGVASANSAATTPGPTTLSSPLQTCQQLTARFPTYPGAGHGASLARVVSPACVLERNDGTTASWPSYPKTHPTCTAWNITVATANFSSPVIRCATITSTTQLVNGGSVVSTPTNRLSTCAWQRGAWRITS